MSINSTNSIQNIISFIELENKRRTENINNSLKSLYIKNNESFQQLLNNLKLIYTSLNLLNINLTTNIILDHLNTTLIYLDVIHKSLHIYKNISVDLYNDLYNLIKLLKRNINDVITSNFDEKLPSGLFSLNKNNDIFNIPQPNSNGYNSFNDFDSDDSKSNDSNVIDVIKNVIDKSSDKIKSNQNKSHQVKASDDTSSYSINYSNKFDIDFIIEKSIKNNTNKNINSNTILSIDDLINDDISSDTNNSTISANTSTISCISSTNNVLINMIHKVPIYLKHIEKIVNLIHIEIKKNNLLEQKN